ncbi:MAG: glycosyltransferase [Rhodospirillales bacterium]|nr:glycosyltransferase [Rhodospirillales bacterium]
MSLRSSPTPDLAPAGALRAPYVSVVVPVYNEEGNIKTLFDRLTAALDNLGKPFEILFVDDGSRDRSVEILIGLHRARPREVRVIELERNYGQHMAIMAAFEKARGEIVVTIDADLQNPPEEIGKLLAAIERGHDVVGGYRKNRQDSPFRRWSSLLINGVRAQTTGIEMRDQGCMLRAYRRDVVRRMVDSRESSTFIPALAQYYAINPAEIEVEHAARTVGASKYNLYRLIRLNFDLMTGFSLVPLQVFTLFGMGVSALSLLLVIYLAFRRLIIGPEAEGLFTLFGILYFLVGVGITGLGIVGEYVGRIYQEVRRRPRFAIKTVHERLDE